MIRRINGGWVLYCDRCSNYEEFDREDTFRDVVAKAKSEGWKMQYRADGVWKHYCPACACGG